MLYRGHEINIEVGRSDAGVAAETWGGAFKFRESGASETTAAGLSRAEPSQALAKAKVLRYAKQMIDTKLALSSR